MRKGRLAYAQARNVTSRPQRRGERRLPRTMGHDALPIKHKLEIVAYAKQNGISAASREFDVDRQNIRLLTMIWKIFEYFRCCCVFQ